MTRLALLLAGLLVDGAAHAEDASSATTAARAPQALQWSWDQPRRLLVEAEVHLPQPMWFWAERNKEQRAVAFQVRAILGCNAGVVERKRVQQVDCRIEDVALLAAGMPQKEGLLAPILLELDQRLTGVTVELQVRHDGRLVNVGMDGLERPRQRVGAINENLRLIMSRAVAGLDFQVPDAPLAPASVWPQYQSRLLAAPSDVGSSGASETLHRVEEVLPDGRYVVASAAEALIVPGGGADKYQTRLSSWSVFDPSAGFLTERAWNAHGRPTAGSAAAEGLAGLPYNQIGRLRLLGADEQVDLGETVEVAPPGVTPTTLQLWPSLGATLR